MAGGEGGTGPIIKLRKYKQHIPGPEWSMSEVGTPTPNNLDKPHRLVAIILESYKRWVKATSGH